MTGNVVLLFVLLGVKPWQVCHGKDTWFWVLFIGLSNWEQHGSSNGSTINRQNLCLLFGVFTDNQSTVV